MTYNQVLPTGADEKRRIIVDYLMAHMNTMMNAARTEWNLSVDDLPDIVAYDEGEPWVGGEWAQDSLLVVSVLGANNFQTDALDDNAQIGWTAHYSVRLYAYFKQGAKIGPDGLTILEEGRPRVTRIRDMTTVCLRVLLLNDPSFGTGEEAWFDPRSLNEVYADIEKLKGDRWITGAYLAFQINVPETVVRTPLGDPANPWSFEVSVSTAIEEIS
jgi:hypothetical protein